MSDAWRKCPDRCGGPPAFIQDEVLDFGGIEDLVYDDGLPLTIGATVRNLQDEDQVRT